jgi:CheY-like chemotaxis protein
MKDVKVLVVDDNPLVLALVAKGLEPYCEVAAARDGADALLRAVDDPPDLILCDYRIPGLDGRQIYEKLRGRPQTSRIPFIFMASRGDIEEKLRPLVEGVEEFITKPFFVKDLVRSAKKVVDRLHLEKLQKGAARPGVIQGRLEEMSMLDLMQSLEMGQKSCKLTVRCGKETCEMFFGAGQCKDARAGGIEGEAAVYQAVRWSEGEFEIDFNAAPTREIIAKTTTGLLMEALRLLDESNRDAADESPAHSKR